MQMEVQQASDGDYATEMKVVTVQRGGLTDDTRNHLRVLLDFGEHGRELITCEVALSLLKLLALPDAALAAALKPLDPELKLMSLLLHTTLTVIPMENEGGRKLVEEGDFCERKNGRGVDPNRNWEVHWGHKERDYDPKEEYPGTQPYSEPEARILKGVADSLQPHIWVNVHSGMSALFMPFDHQDHIPEGEAAQQQLQILHQLNNISCNNNCAVGSGGKTVGYLAHGTATDYMYAQLKVPLAFTWEIYGDTTAGYYECFRMFNPEGETAMHALVKQWTDAVFHLLLLLPLHDSMKPFLPLMQPWLAMPGGPSAAHPGLREPASPWASPDPQIDGPHSSSLRGVQVRQNVADEGALLNRMQSTSRLMFVAAVLTVAVCAGRILTPARLRLGGASAAHRQR